jgi:multicomponent Na+:H+ antiporter subunit F
VVLLAEGLAALLLLTVALGLVPVLRSRVAGEVLLAVQLIGTTSVAVLLLLGRAMSAPALVDTALVFALLAAVAVVAFVRGGAPAEEERQ